MPLGRTRRADANRKPGVGANCWRRTGGRGRPAHLPPRAPTKTEKTGRQCRPLMRAPGGWPGRYPRRPVRRKPSAVPGREEDCRRPACPAAPADGGESRRRSRRKPGRPRAGPGPAARADGKHASGHRSARGGRTRRGATPSRGPGLRVPVPVPARLRPRSVRAGGSPPCSAPSARPTTPRLWRPHPRRAQPPHPGGGQGAARRRTPGTAAAPVRPTPLAGRRAGPARRTRARDC